MQARPIKNVTGAFDATTGNIAVQITDAADASLAVALDPKATAQLVGFVLKLGATAAGQLPNPGAAAQVEGLHPQDFGFGPGQTSAETVLAFQIGSVRLALSLPTDKCVAMCRAVVERVESGAKPN